MSHVLGKIERHERRSLGKVRAAVTVKVVGKRSLQIDPALGICIAKSDTEWAELPKDFIVTESESARPIKPSRSKKFYISVHTIDPFHLLTEATEAE